MSDTVSLDVELRSPIERVWHALTDAATLSEWTLFETSDFEPVVGHRFSFRGKPATGWTGTVACEVLEVEKPHRLSYTWVVGDQSHPTKVTWTLTETEDGVTGLHLEQSGFASQATQQIAGAKYGWTHMLDRLQSLLASA